MRLWSLHPKYLDAKGLVALWREALLAQAVLKGQTKGYTHHPQLLRFREAVHPRHAIAHYLRVVHEEAERRGYNFDRRKIGRCGAMETIRVTRGQMQYEWQHLQAKLAQRDPARLKMQAGLRKLEPNTVFRVVTGKVEAWEKVP